MPETLQKDTSAKSRKNVFCPNAPLLCRLVLCFANLNQVSSLDLRYYTGHMFLAMLTLVLTSISGSAKTLLFTPSSDMLLKCVSCDHVWSDFKSRVCNFVATYIMYYISVFLLVIQAQQRGKKTLKSPHCRLPIYFQHTAFSLFKSYKLKIFCEFLHICM